MYRLRRLSLHETTSLSSLFPIKIVWGFFQCAGFIFNLCSMHIYVYPLIVFLRIMLVFFSVHMNNLDNQFFRVLLLMYKNEINTVIPSDWTVTFLISDYPWCPEMNTGMENSARGLNTILCFICSLPML